MIVGINGDNMVINGDNMVINGDNMVIDDGNVGITMPLAPPMDGNGEHTNYLWWWLGDDVLFVYPY